MNPIPKLHDRTEPCWKQQPQAVRKDVTVSGATDDSVVCGDAGTLTEALTNIVGNAVKYSFQGGTVTVTAAGLGDEVRIDVHDTGVGVPDDEKARIFDDFYRSETGLAVWVAGVDASMPASRRASLLAQAAWPSTRRSSTGRPGRAASRSCRVGQTPPQRFWSQPRPCNQPSGVPAAAR